MPSSRRKCGSARWRSRSTRPFGLPSPALNHRSGCLAVLVSYIGSSTVEGALSYAIVQLEIGATQGSVTVAAVKHLSFQAVS